jgi:hypothetical protein
MGLGKRKQTSVLDRLRYNARTGVMFKVRRVLDNNEWFNDEAPIEHAKFLGLFDLENLLIGWQAYVKGVGADFRPVKVDQDYGDPPSDAHKLGVRLLVLLDGEEEARELASTAGAVWNALDTLHDAYLAARDKHSGKLPVVTINGTNVTGSASQPSHEPLFNIMEWVPRPAALPPGGIPVPEPKRRSAPETTSEPAKSKPAKHAGMDDEIPF